MHPTPLTRVLHAHSLICCPLVHHSGRATPRRARRRARAHDADARTATPTTRASPAALLEVGRRAVHRQVALFARSAFHAHVVAHVGRRRERVQLGGGGSFRGRHGLLVVFVGEIHQVVARTRAGGVLGRAQRVAAGERVLEAHGAVLRSLRAECAHKQKTTQAASAAHGTAQLAALRSISPRQRLVTSRRLRLPLHARPSEMAAA